MISLTICSSVNPSTYSAIAGTFSTNTSTNTTNVRSITSNSNNSLTRGNAASATGTISALSLIVPNASNTSLTVANSLPVNSLTTASNSGNASMMIAISLANEIPSYNPSETFASENFASTVLIAYSASPL